jgi:hypothetical protein
MPAQLNASLGVIGAVTVVAAITASADPKPPALVGAKQVLQLTTSAGFIDDPIASDDARLAYVVADGAAKAELHVVTLATKAEQIAEISAVTAHPIALALAGSRAVVVGVNEDTSELGAVVELAKGTAIAKLGPAAHVSIITRDGHRVVAVDRLVDNHHEIELDALETGRRITAGRPFDPTAIDFRVNHWSDGMTRAYGIKGGEWNKKDDTRSPDVEATYDLVLGRFVQTKPIPDLFEQRKRFQTLAADGANKLDFFRMTPTAVALWHDGKPRTLELDQPVGLYDPQSIEGVIAADGSAWFMVKIDPVNPEAVARKKADVEYLDIFHVGTETKAIRKARVLATKTRHHMGVIGATTLWLLERNTGFERGGKSLTVYQLD